MLESCTEYNLLPDVNDVINHPELVDYQERIWKFRFLKKIFFPNFVNHFNILEQTQSVVSFIVGAAIEARAQQLQDQMDI